MLKILAAYFFIVTLAAAAFAQDTASVPRITVEELKARLDRGDKITVLDVRQPGAYGQAPIR